MRDIHHSQAANSDLVDIWVETCRQWGEAQADRYLDDIDRALQRLIDNPQMGVDCSDLLQGARKLITADTSCSTRWTWTRSS